MLFLLSELSLSKNTSKRVQLAKVGTFNHQIYGKFSISLSDLHKMKRHFEENARRQELEEGPAIPIDYSHEDGKKSAGWGLKLSVEKDKKGVDGLFGVVEWTPAGAKAIRDKEFKFISPDIRRGYKDSETGEKFDVVLAGAALTNVPFLRDMEAVHLLSEDRQKAFESLKLSGDDPGNSNLNQGENMKTIAEILAAMAELSPEDKLKLSESLVKEFKFTTEEDSKKLSEELEKAQGDLKLAEKAVEDAGKDDSDSEKKLKLAEKEIKDLSGKVTELISGLAKKDRESDFNMKLSEGKVCEAQRESFIKQDMDEFLKLAEPIKLKESGSNNSTDIDNSETTDKVMKLAEKKMESDENLGFQEAVSMVLSENKDLSKAYNQG